VTGRRVHDGAPAPVDEDDVECVNSAAGDQVGELRADEADAGPGVGEDVPQVAPRSAGSTGVSNAPRQPAASHRTTESIEALNRSLS